MGSSKSEHDRQALENQSLKTGDDQEIVVVGAGLVGAIQALLFARDGFNVTVVEQKALRSEDESTHPATDAIGSRTVALSHRSWQLLSGAALWPDIEVCPIKTVHVTQQGFFGSVKINADQLDVDALGYVVSNTGFELFLHKLIKQVPNIDVIEHASIVSVENQGQSALVTVEQSGVEQSLNARLVVAADGTHSTIREMLGIGTTQHDYKQCAVLANVQASGRCGNVAYERFTKDGPLALLPLSGSKKDDGEKLYSMIYTAPASEKDLLSNLSDNDFLSVLQKKFGGRLGRFVKVGKRVVTPLMLTVSNKQVNGCVVLIGNAARTLHPVAGQGLNLALRDVFELSVSLNASFHGSGTMENALTAFEKFRRRDQWLVTRETDLLARVFTDKPWSMRMPLSLLTGSSFVLLDFITPLKKAFAATKMGRQVPLPREPGEPTNASYQ